ncbi:hypothetical protein LB518_09635 [Mesorhizobium sp. BR1-1-16]|uniref:lysozyme inhibitor LprI family protein n=1 Tax=Mesorhizobium sp. BR1-1-16 TaxID=2876653 RepID=UPI001CCCB1BB|nr:hypothetical protein [Mesorhizobium sp. BR1-1-16]MBZ9936556.1 hypothetical protein [Mesorhizobium sp. BR1-1-16]
MQAVSRHWYIVALACALASLAFFTGPSSAQQLFPADIFPMFRGLGEREVPPPGQRSLQKRPANRTTVRPSFDCRRAKLAAEAAICSQADLAALDRAMAESYKMALLANPGNRAALKAQQKRYIARRNACGGSADCLRQAMMDQIARLDPAAAGTDSDDAAADINQTSAETSPLGAPSFVGTPTSGIEPPSIASPVPCDPPPPNGSRFVCFNAGLMQLDGKMVSAVSAILTSETKPRDFESSQLAWVARRDDCGNDTCISSLYGKRLAELADFVPRDKPSDVASPAMAETTRRIAAEWNLPILRGRLYLPQPDIDRLSHFSSDGPALSAWKTFILAAGLAAEPDLAPQYNEDTAAFIGCTMLDEDIITKIGTQELCRYMSFHTGNSEEYGQYLRAGEARVNFPGAEFALHDFSSRFKADYLPKIISAGPKPPFEVVIVVPAGVSDYDLTTGQFRISPEHRGDESYGVLGSSTNLVLRNLIWPASEKEARAFAATQEHSYRAFIAIPMTIKGVAAGKVYSTNGLPGGFRWEIEAGDPALYDDEHLTNRLYAFPTQARLPRVIADKGGAVPIFGDVPLNDETMMLVLLKSGVLSPDRVNWENAAQKRYDDEQIFSHRTDWTNVDPWGLWFTARPSGNPDLVARFRGWTMRRVAALRDQVVLRQERPFASAQGGLLALGQERSYISTDNQALIQSLASTGRGSSNIVGNDFRIPAVTGPIVAVAPLGGSAYVIPTPEINGTDPAVLETVLRLGPARTVGTGSVLEVTPLSSRLRVGEKVVASVGFPPPEDQSGAAVSRAQAAAQEKQAALDKEAAEAAAAAAAKAAIAAQAENQQKSSDAAVRTTAAGYLDGDVSGPDVLGIRLGMSIDEADAIVRKAIDVGWVLENADDRTNFDALDHVRVYVSSDKSENIALQLPHDDQPQHVIGVERFVAVAPTVPEKGIEKLLIGKYGAPSMHDEASHTWIWADKKIDQGVCSLSLSMSHNMRTISGPDHQEAIRLLQSTRLSMRTPVGGPNNETLAGWSGCRPIVRATRGSDYVSTELWDMRALVAIATSAVGAANIGDEPEEPAIKF